MHECIEFFVSTLCVCGGILTILGTIALFIKGVQWVLR